MEESSEKINTVGLRKFVKHLALVSSKYKDREDARDGLKKQIKKLKASSLGKKTKKKIMNEFEELENKISLVLNKEAEILQVRRSDEAAYDALVDKVEENKNKMDQINDALSELRSNMQSMSNLKLNREQRIKKLEKKIKSSHKKKKSLPDISAKLKLLEDKYHELKTDPMYDYETLEKIKNKIDSLKLKAAVSEF